MIVNGIKLTSKQKEFCDRLVETKNPSLAAEEAYDIGSRGGRGNVDKTVSTARTIASINLDKPNIRQYLESISGNAANRIEQLSVTAKNESVRLKANQDILDRAGYKAAESLDITSRGEKIDLIEQKVALILTGKNDEDVQEREDSESGEGVVQG
ncbi:MAG: hypothetical protein DRI86_07465 [Bacteroidetes bacterium]|nr:MAG: hypothetical protein DRI86_07465 [Bacteroidota bacterium]